MIYSKAVLSTDKQSSIKLNWWEYWIGHCWMTGWQSIHGAFRIWSDLMTDNFKDYALLKDDDDAEECRQWFWVSLGEDNVYPKEFLEYLSQLADDVQTGKVKTYPVTEDFFDHIKDLVGDLLEEGDNEDTTR